MPQHGALVWRQVADWYQGDCVTIGQTSGLEVIRHIHCAHGARQCVALWQPATGAFYHYHPTGLFRAQTLTQALHPLST